MPDKIFWAWQSDLNQTVCRNLIKNALELAITTNPIGSDIEERIELDHDTKGRPGLTPISDSIFQKIDQAQLFVADLTPIGRSEGGKWLANPNVLIELGYAKKALGPERIILVWNKAFDGTVPENLPFDLRHRTGPIGYTLLPSCTDAERRKVRASLANELAAAIKLNWPKPELAAVAVPQWRGNFGDDPCLWLDRAEPVIVNESEVTRTLLIRNDVDAWIRILPSVWPDGVSSADLEHPSPMGRWTGLSWGRATGGLLAYAGNYEEQSIRTGAIWFPETGEVWSFMANAFAGNELQRTFNGTAMLERWIDFLRFHVSRIEQAGGKGSFLVKLGIENLSGSQWIEPNSALAGVAVEPRFEFDFQFSTLDNVADELWKAWRKLIDIFGEGPGVKSSFENFVRARLDR